MSSPRLQSDSDHKNERHLLRRLMGLLQLIRRSRRLATGGVIGTILTVALGLVLLFTRAGTGLVNLSYDLQFVPRDENIPQEVVMVYMDDESHAVLGENYDVTWNRGLHADLLDILREQGARAVVFDVVFSGFDDPENDRFLAESISRFTNIVLAGEVDPGWRTIRPPIFTNDASLKKIWVDETGNTVTNLPWRAALTNHPWGAAQFPFTDAVIRQPLPDVFGTPTLAFVAAEQLGADLSKVARADTNRLWINYYGPPRKLPQVSYFEVIDENIPAEISLADKIVIIGADVQTGTTGAVKDQFGTAYSRILPGSGFAAPGPEIVATILLNLLRGELLLRVPRGIELLISIVVGLFAGLYLSRQRPQTAAVLALAGFALLAGGNQLLFQKQLTWFAWAIPAVQLALGWVWAMGVHSLRAHVQSEILENTLAYHLPKERARQLKDRPDLLRTHGEKTPVGFMFTDIKDFTTISDRTPPDVLFQNLNDYFQHVVPAIHDTDGTVMQFVGDAIYAIWNAPTAQEDYADRVIRAGIELAGKLEAARAANKDFAFTTRIGLHAGFAYVGNCGSSDRFEYAAIGKDTNLAARLEGLNKYIGTQIVASDALVQKTTGGFLFRPLGAFRVKGSDHIPEVHEVVGYADTSNDAPDWIETFKAGLIAFRQRDWNTAEAAFKKTMQIKPSDQPSQFYLDAIACNRKNPPGDNWLGEVTLSGK